MMLKACSQTDFFLEFSLTVPFSQSTSPMLKSPTISSITLLFLSVLLSGWSSLLQTSPACQLARPAVDNRWQLTVGWHSVWLSELLQTHSPFAVGLHHLQLGYSWLRPSHHLCECSCPVCGHCSGWEETQRSRWSRPVWFRWRSRCPDPQCDKIWRSRSAFLYYCWRSKQQL